MDRFTELIEQIGKALIGIRLKSALEDKIKGMVEINSGLVKLSRLVLFLALIEALLHLCHQDINRWSRIMLKRRQVNRMFRQGKGLVDERRDGSRSRGRRTHLGLFRRDGIFATSKENRPGGE